MANGQQNSNNGISIDGISTVSAVWGGASVITPSEDSIDNVRIVTNDYDAEDGRFAGAQTMVTSKSGTNQLHGSLFIAIHRPGLNAFQPAVRTSNGTRVGAPQRDTGRYNQWGGSLGGPIHQGPTVRVLRVRDEPEQFDRHQHGMVRDVAVPFALHPRAASRQRTSNFPAARRAARSSRVARPAPPSA